ncbi:unnamed protein product [Linum tenue]|uniref:Survival protein SurE-like phosphatase/nucleotidase domain-containing protein n=1 Tax=Linum tenue TaxID=586396 RepID=A0AAV0RPM2_9ROSI|nr:unnamed protein product [Linum tenue]
MIVNGFPATAAYSLHGPPNAANSNGNARRRFVAKFPRSSASAKRTLFSHLASCRSASDSSSSWSSLVPPSRSRMENSVSISDHHLPTVMITNDDGIDAPGLRSLVRVLVSSRRFHVLVCAPDSEKSAVSHSITWRHPISAQRVEIDGATAYGVSGTPADCTSLGISGALFPSVPDLVALCLSSPASKLTLRRMLLMILFRLSDSFLVVSGINMGSNCGYHIVYSGTVAGAREAFFNDIPSISVSYDWVGGKSSVEDFTLAAEACIPIITGILAEVKSKKYPSGCFLNVDLPTNVTQHKGYKLTRQSRSIYRMGWKQVTSTTQGGKMLSTMTMDTDGKMQAEADTKDDASQGNLVFKREVRGAQIVEDDTDHKYLKDGYITVTPLSALSPADVGCHTYFKDWLPSVVDHTSPSAL